MRLAVSRRAIRFCLCVGTALLILIGWAVTDYLWMKQAGEKARDLRAQLTLETRSLRENLHVQQEKFLSIRERIKAGQQILANWKGRRKQIEASAPRERESSLTRQQVVQDLEASLASLQGELETLIGSIPTEWPTKGRISSGFGKRRSPWTGKTAFHDGIDMANRRGTPVIAPGAAVVEYAGKNGGYGRTIVLNHGQGIITRYAHLSKFYVKKGDRVRKNQKIANMGNTGKSTNSHLHYIVQINGIAIDPRRYLLKQSPSSSSKTDKSST